MRRIVIWVMSTLSAVVLLFSYHTSTESDETTAGTSGAGGGDAPPSGSATPSASSATSGATGSTPSSTGSATPGTYTGETVATQWGDVQVQITVQDGKITDAQAVTYPNGNHRDAEINAYALPVLRQEVLTAQSATIDAVSGATVTSNGYISSLQSAIDQAHL